MMAALLPWLKPKFTDANNQPLAGGKLYSYIAGTNTPLQTFVDSTENTPNTNPIILDANGEASIWLNEASVYKFVLTDAEGVPIDTIDGVKGASGGGGGSGGGGWSAWARHAVADGQGPTDLAGETVDFDANLMAQYDCAIRRGTTVVAGFSFDLQNFNGTGRICKGAERTEELHGVTFSAEQVGSDPVWILRAQLDSGAGDGVIMLSRRLVPL